jgi:2-polyprenyl-3-methyl-5-hydroxy-6-metoxy-1,4-benzoquinol methylase
MHRLEQISAVFPRILEPRLVTLDAGASSGEFVFLMQELGHDATGLEAHEGYASHARGALGLNVENGVFSSFTPGRKRFDLITMFHVLEHLEFPVEELERLSEALSDTGIFVLEVPNILHRGMRFSHKWHSAHLSGFSQRTFEATALRAGLHPLLSGETEDGANLFGIFRKGEKISSESVRDQLGGAQPELDQLVANSDSDYFSRTSTWLKIGPKLFSQVEERWTSSRFSNGAEILKAVYRGIL